MSTVMNVDWRTLPNAPDAGTLLCALEDLVTGEIARFIFPEQPETTETDPPPFKLLVFLFENSVFGYVNQCPHHWLDMSRRDGKFLMWKSTQLMCAHHSAVFDLVDAGRCIMGPCQGSNLIRVPLMVEDGRVWISSTS